MFHIRHVLAAALLLAQLGTAQWSSDPALNLTLADDSGDQVQTKLVPTDEGGAYISWLDGGAGGYDVRLQRVDVDGHELWSHGGILVADRGFSSTQDYGLSVDASGAAVLAFRDDRGVGVQVTAARVSPAGALLWGPAGTTLTNTSAFIGAPRITGTDDGGIVVAWTQDSTTVVQRLDAAGALQWSPHLTLVPPAGTYFASDLQAAGSEALLALVHQTGSAFWSPKHLKVFKVDATGTTSWGPVAVFDADSLQVGHFPTFVPDGSGGAVFGWYGVSPLQCYAQHIRADGSEAFPHNGSAASMNTAQVRVDPSVSYDAASGSTYLFWTEQNSGQSAFGLSGQEFDAAGNRQWSQVGSTLLPLGSPEIRSVRTSVGATGLMVLWTFIPGWGMDTMHGALIDGAGSMSLGPFDVASTPGGKSRVQAARGTNDQVMLSWSDRRSGADDVLAQAVQPDGSLGMAEGLGDGFCVSTPNSSGQGAVMGASGSASIAANDLVLTVDGMPDQMGIFFYGTHQQAGGAGVPFGNGTLCIGGQIFRLLPPYLASGNAASRPVDLSSPPQASGQITMGSTWHFQAWFRDPLAGGAFFDFSDALTITFDP